MCRHLAYVGPEIPFGQVVLDPPYGLYRQSWAPRHQRHGTVNADGFGVGWYAPDDPVPARYRRAGPIWADEQLPDLARVVRTRSLLAAVRDATVAGADAEAAAAPFATGRYLFSHNGAVAGWPDTMAPLAAGLPPVELLHLQARSDSAFLWALVHRRLVAGDDPGRALAAAVEEVAAAATGSRLTLLLTDGAGITGTTWGDTLFHRVVPGGGRVVASEPYDESPHWTEVPDRTLLCATPTEVRLTPLKEPAT
ncbi:hypothetical protein SAZ_35725 [Streptomyces noursei ZPM]|uniref:Gamma-glutamyl-hercynylcysteine sulfoxide hydrolase n=1 Tax=Streptomyces noursei TaxID=1971 RepID=A0A401RBP4_STRNR|nr:ergothioneine biosynthesis protein EgtC [Streptomyces noursei]AKA07151.1 hypothetical protein SAZ_35725 [Streptomyces noursei ZPM]EOT00798.2 hypothetical protein K530_27029 [Streptomyces noursei CCRC 11814]EXU85425.1 hypothetical protein P354_09900 [Streptomyces noursei PD-1]UWS75707.1 ergothioneine biosynthesis protein EgtC [Streptomyces noursei]GCB95038.1 gamma-glutamyl-hercynylcysteine sulfoxide hydrolase [Streptomyces noursei]